MFAKKEQSNPVTIDLQNYDPVYTQRLIAFFNEQLKLGFKQWDRENQYIFSDGTRFSFKNSLYQRWKDNITCDHSIRYPENISHLICYDLLEDEMLATGAHGSVVNVIANMCIDNNNNTITLIKDPGLVTKIQFNNAEIIEDEPDPHENTITNLSREYFNSISLAKHLNMRIPTIIIPKSGLDANAPKKYPHANPFQPSVKKIETVCYITMNKQAGRNLQDILDEDYENNNLTTAQRLNLSEKLMYKLQTQIWQNKTVHRDLHPGNILVDLGPPIKVNFVDYSYSIDLEKRNDGLRGCCAYIAPEQLRAHTTNSKEDVYPLGRVLSLIWRANRILNKGDESHTRIMPRKSLIDGIFTGIFDLSSELSDRIQTTILGMLEINPADRFSIDEAIDNLFSEQMQKPLMDRTTQALNDLFIEQKALFFIHDMYSYSPEKAKFFDLADRVNLCIHKNNIPFSFDDLDIKPRLWDDIAKIFMDAVLIVENIPPAPEKESRSFAYLQKMIQALNKGDAYYFWKIQPDYGYKSIASLRTIEGQKKCTELAQMLWCQKTGQSISLPAKPLSLKPKKIEPLQPKNMNPPYCLTTNCNFSVSPILPDKKDVASSSSMQEPMKNDSDPTPFFQLQKDELPSTSSPIDSDTSLIEKSLPKDTNSASSTPSVRPNYNMMILSGAISVLGITAVAIAFTVLNATTLGIVLAIAGGAALVGGIISLGIFAYKNKSERSIQIYKPAYGNE